MATATITSTGVTGATVDRSVLVEGVDEPPDDEYLGTPVTTMSYTSGTTGRPKGIIRPRSPTGSGKSTPQPLRRLCTGDLLPQTTST